LADKINKLGASFKAVHYPRFENKTKQELNQFLGATPPPDAEQARRRRSVNEYIRDKRAISVPASFDSRSAFYGCASTIGIIQNQGNCGDCWAVSTASAITDRRCIYTGGNDLAQISAWDLTSCCTKCISDGVNGCNGGYTAYAADFYKSSGIVTGSTNAKNYGCKPFPLTPTAAKPSSTVRRQACSANWGVSYFNDKRGPYTPYGRFVYVNNVTGVQWDIMNYGSIVAQFDVYQDFYQYSSGVYTHVTGSYIGLHAIRIIGWGVENNVPYWLAANSWGTSWGISGFFKFRRGINHLGIESYVVATYP